MRHILSVVFVLKFGLALTVIPSLQVELFVPFLDSLSGGFDPWGDWIQDNGQPSAFPYGLGMFAALSPSIFLSEVLPGLELNAKQLLLAFNILVIDSFFSYVIFRYIKNKNLVLIYLFGPTFVWISYIHGQLDIVPTYFLLFFAIMLKDRNSLGAGISLGLAIGAKFSFALILPILLVWLFDNPRGLQKKHLFFGSCGSVIALSYFPAVYSSSFRQMILQTPEVNRLQEIGLDLGEAEVLLMPLVFMFLLYFVWNLGRTNVDAFLLVAGISLLTVSLFTPSSIGWFLWFIPLLLVGLKEAKREWVYGIFLLQLFVLWRWLSSNDEVLKLRMNHSQIIRIDFFGYSSIAWTLTIALGIVIAISILRYARIVSEGYDFSRRPLSISIAGDSGVGKDTLSSCLSETFGNDFSFILSGDSFHRHERGDIAWSRYTHLNPRANNLHAWSDTLSALLKRRSILLPHYNHSNGRFTHSLLKKRFDLVISQGLHALYPIVSGVADIKVFLKMNLETQIGLKIERDTRDRGHTKAKVQKDIERRLPDFETFILPQEDNANLIFELGRSSIRSNDLNSLVVITHDYDLAIFLYRFFLWFDPGTVKGDIEKNSPSFKLDVKLIDTRLLFQVIQECFPRSGHLLVQYPLKHDEFYKASVLMVVVIFLALGFFRSSDDVKIT